MYACYFRGVYAVLGVSSGSPYMKRICWHSWVCAVWLECAFLSMGCNVGMYLGEPMMNSGLDYLM